MVLLASTEWIVLGTVALFLAAAWLISRPDREPLPTGLLFAAILAVGALIFALGGGLGIDVALRRALRAALIVMVATWLRAAAGAEGLREVFRRVLGRLRAIPSLPEAAEVLDRIAAEGRLAAAASSLAEQLRDVPLRPIPFCDAVLAWVVSEARAFRPQPPEPTGAARATGGRPAARRPGGGRARRAQPGLVLPGHSALVADELLHLRAGLLGGLEVDLGRVLRVPGVHDRLPFVGDVVRRVDLLQLVDGVLERVLQRRRPGS